MEALEQLRIWRTKHGKSVMELASDLKLARPYVSDVLRGVAPITEGFIGRFFLAYGPDEAAKVFNHLVQPPEINEATTNV